MRSNKCLHRYFCKICGVHVWMEGFYESNGKRNNLFVVNLSSVDQPQDGVDLSQVKLSYFDLLNDNFAGSLKEKPWPYGLP